MYSRARPSLWSANQSAVQLRMSNHTDTSALTFKLNIEIIHSEVHVVNKIQQNLVLRGNVDKRDPDRMRWFASYQWSPWARP